MSENIEVPVVNQEVKEETKREPLHFNFTGETVQAPSILPNATIEVNQQSISQGPTETVAQGSVSCHICSVAFKHCEVVMLGTNKAKDAIAIHPSCLKEGVDVAELTNINVALDATKKVSSAKALVTEKQIKALIKRIQKAQASQQKGQ